MSLNDNNLTSGVTGVDIHSGVANPTSSSVTDPTTDKRGGTFDKEVQAKRAMKQTAGVIEARPGIIESCHIDPLKEDSNKDDGWANVSGK